MVGPAMRRSGSWCVCMFCVVLVERQDGGGMRKGERGEREGGNWLESIVEGGFDGDL